MLILKIFCKIFGSAIFRKGDYLGVFAEGLDVIDYFPVLDVRLAHYLIPLLAPHKLACFFEDQDWFVFC